LASIRARWSRVPESKIIQFAKKQARRLDARVAKFLLPFSRAEAQIAKLVLVTITSGNLWQARYRRRQSAEAQAIARHLFREIDEATSDLVLDHFTIGQRIVDVATGEVVTLSRIQQEALHLLQEQLHGDLTTAVRVMGRRVEDVFRKEGLRAAIRNLQGDPVELTSVTMRRELQRDGITSFIDRTGRRWGLDQYASMAVRTVTAEAQNTATRLVLVEKSFDVVEINHVANPCADCLPYNGKEFSLTGRTPDLPVLRNDPPFHGNCRHYMMPNRRTVEERQLAGIILPEGISAA
jgi:Phage minor capsid protein 2